LSREDLTAEQATKRLRELGFVAQVVKGGWTVLKGGTKRTAEDALDGFVNPFSVEIENQYLLVKVGGQKGFDEERLVQNLSQAINTIVTIFQQREKIKILEDTVSSLESRIASLESVAEGSNEQA
jgi:hypothetical protein